MESRTKRRTGARELVTRNYNKLFASRYEKLYCCPGPVTDCHLCSFTVSAQFCHGTGQNTFSSRLPKTDNRKRLSHYIFTKLGNIHEERKNATTALFSSQNKTFSRHIFSGRQNTTPTGNRVNEAYTHTFTRKYFLNRFSNKVTDPAKISWKRKLHVFLNNRQNTLIGKMALALRRPYIVLPCTVATTCDNKLLAQKSVDTDPFRYNNTLYTRAQEGHAIMRSKLSSLFEEVVLLLRTIYLGILFSPSIAMAPFADYFGDQYRKIWLHLVLHTLERAGPAFIKWGQWAATRPDLFAKDLCTILSKLHTKAPEHSFTYTKKTIEKAFNHKLSEIFDYFEEAPVASGSVAQIHKAYLKYRFHGQEIKKPMPVAVKVRHPGVGDSIRRDFKIINIIAKCSTYIPTLKWLRLDESVKQFSTFMMSQVDLAREAANLSRFIYNFRGWRDVSFPKPVYPLVHPAVLVESFEQGESVAYYVDELQGHEKLRSKIAHIGTHAFLKMLLVDNFIHADMHPGNILVRVAQSKRSPKGLFKSKPHVVYLDVGMTAELSKSDKENLLEFFKSVARRDGRTAAECTLRLSKKQNCPNPEAFIQEVEESFDFWGTSEGDLVHPADCMHHLLEQVRRHRVNVDGNVCTALVTTLVLEGWQRKLDPDYDIMHTLRTLLLKEDWANSLSHTIEALMGP